MIAPDEFHKYEDETMRTDPLFTIGIEDRKKIREKGLLFFCLILDDTNGFFINLEEMGFGMSRR